MKWSLGVHHRVSRSAACRREWVRAGAIFWLSWQLWRPARPSLDLRLRPVNFHFSCDDQSLRCQLSTELLICMPTSLNPVGWRMASAEVSTAAPAEVGGTDQVYFQDTYLFTCEATVVKASRTEDGQISIVTDRTVLHPQGGKLGIGLTPLTSPSQLCSA